MASASEDRKRLEEELRKVKAQMAKQQEKYDVELLAETFLKAV